MPSSETTTKPTKRPVGRPKKPQLTPGEKAILEMKEQADLPVPSTSVEAVEKQPRKTINPYSIVPKTDKQIADEKEILLKQLKIEEEIAVPIPRVGQEVLCGIGRHKNTEVGVVTRVMNGGRCDLTVFPHNQAGVRCIEGAYFHKDPGLLRRYQKSNFSPNGTWSINEEGLVNILVERILELTDKVDKLTAKGS